MFLNFPNLEANLKYNIINPWVCVAHEWREYCVSYLIAYFHIIIIMQIQVFFSSCEDKGKKKRNNLCTHTELTKDKMCWRRLEWISQYMLKVLETFCRHEMKKKENIKWWIWLWWRFGTLLDSSYEYDSAILNTNTIV